MCCWRGVPRSSGCLSLWYRLRSNQARPDLYERTKRELAGADGVEVRPELHASRSWSRRSSPASEPRQPARSRSTLAKGTARPDSRPWPEIMGRSVAIPSDLHLRPGRLQSASGTSARGSTSTTRTSAYPPPIRRRLTGPIRPRRSIPYGRSCAISPSAWSRERTGDGSK